MCGRVKPRDGRQRRRRSHAVPRGGQDRGPKTNAAIARFQQVQLKIFDAVIERNKKTILKLNEILEPVARVRGVHRWFNLG
jgi:hypothetical protein